MASRSTRFAFAGALLAAAALWLASPAAAQKCKPQTEVPPGNSEIAQYVESVPGACGDETPSGGSGGGGGSGGSGSSGGGSSLPSSTQSELEDLGPAGVATAEIANATAPAGAAEGGGGKDADGGDGESGATIPADAASVEDLSDGSVLGALVDALTGAGEIGVALPIALAAILLGGLAFLVMRRRQLD